MAVCVCGIAGMIAGSVADSNAVALTFGLITASAVLCLIVATAVAGTTPGHSGAGRQERLDEIVQRLVEAGADESVARRSVEEAAGLGTAHERE